MGDSKKLGEFGEKIAEKYLRRKGYKVLDKNFRYSNLGELDIIAKLDNSIIFFEVKARIKKSVSDFIPEDNITYQKQKKLIKLSQIYLGKKDLLERSWQIDIIAIDIYRDKSYDIRHLENAVGDLC